jgi:hypothetical protein
MWRFRYVADENYVADVFVTKEKSIDSILVLDGINFYVCCPLVACLRDQYPIIFEKRFLSVGKITDRGNI